MYNREFQRRTAARVLARLNTGLARDESGFYRPEKRVAPRQDVRNRSGRLRRALSRDSPMQLALNFADPEKPLGDLFPEAYE